MRNGLQIAALLLLTLLGGGAFLGYHFYQRAPSWKRLDAVIAEHFVDLPGISIDELNQWLSDEQRQRPIVAYAAANPRADDARPYRLRCRCPTFNPPHFCLGK